MLQLTALTLYKHISYTCHGKFKINNKNLDGDGEFDYKK